MRVSNILLLTVMLIWADVRVESMTMVLDAIIDMMLPTVIKKIMDMELDTLHLPDLEQKLQFGWNVKCIDGSIRNLTSIKRRGDVVIKKESNQTLINATLGFEQLEVNFNCSVNTLFSTSVNVTAKTNENCIELQIILVWNDTVCNATLNYFKITELNGVTLDTQGNVIYKIIQFAFNQILMPILGRFLGYIVNGTVKEMVKDAMAKQDVCAFIPKSFRNILGIQNTS